LHGKSTGDVSDDRISIVSRRIEVAKHTVVIEPCQLTLKDEEIVDRTEEMLAKIPNVRDRIGKAGRIFVKVNMGMSHDVYGRQLKFEDLYFQGRAIEFVDPLVLKGLLRFLRSVTSAGILIGDGTLLGNTDRMAEEHGFKAIIEESGAEYINLNNPPFSRFSVPEPVMFHWYELAESLKDVDLTVSLASLKSHHLCGVSLCIKNLFGLAPEPVYGSPLVALHSPVRTPRVIADFAKFFPPEICLIDGIVGCNFMEWFGLPNMGNPVDSNILIAGDNAVATDATAARIMCVDPLAERGTPPFLGADNHIRIAADAGLGSARFEDIDIVGEIPSGRKPYSIRGQSEPEVIERRGKATEAESATARKYFADRDRLAGEYTDELIWYREGKVRAHIPAAQYNMQDRKARTDFLANLKGPGTFCKLVRADEDELTAPYEVA